MSTGTALSTVGVLSLSLAQLCEFIDTHRSLQRARIMSTSCYSERPLLVTHRFLVLKIERNSKKSIWVRFDRRPSRSSGLRGLVLGGGRTPANDTVSSAAIGWCLYREACLL